jgi:hypothetical protein
MERSVFHEMSVLDLNVSSPYEMPRQQLVSVRLPQELLTTGPSLPLIVVSCCIVSAESAVYLVNEGGC